MSTFHVPQLQRPCPSMNRASPSSSRASSFSIPKPPRHNAPAAYDFRLSRSSSASSLAPPPYVNENGSDEQVPEYGRQEEVKTMARALFLYGFLFPPFWILGSLILITPLTPDPSWHNTKPEEQIQVILQAMRTAERRWAWRCVIALCTLFFLIFIAVGSVLLAHHFGRL